MFVNEMEVSAGVSVGDDCPFDYRVYTDRVEFEWGGRRGLYVQITEEGLSNLITSATEALNELRAQDDNDDVE